MMARCVHLWEEKPCFWEEDRVNRFQSSVGLEVFLRLSLGEVYPALDRRPTLLRRYGDPGLNIGEVFCDLQ